MGEKVGLHLEKGEAFLCTISYIVEWKDLQT